MFSVSRPTSVRPCSAAMAAPQAIEPVENTAPPARVSKKIRSALTLAFTSPVVAECRNTTSSGAR